MTSREVALDYVNRGWSPIPIPVRSKAPTISDWPSLRITSAADIERLFGVNDNVGILNGQPSSWLVDVDLDTPQALELALTMLPPTLRFGRPGRPLSHWLYYAEGATTAKFADPETHSMLLELRSTGTQTVFPPSIHPSGETVLFEDSDAPPTELDAAHLRKRVQRLAAAVLMVRHGYAVEAARACAEHWEPGCDDGLPEVVAARAREWSTGLSVAPRPVATAPVTSGGAGSGDPVRRAAGYLAKIGGAVAGARGHDVTWAAAVALVRGFALSSSDALSLLMSDYNPRCSPPWSERELRHKVESAERDGRLPRGYLLDNPRRDWSQYRTSAPAVDASSNPTAADIFEMVDIASVPDEGPARWLVDGLWSDQAVGIVGGEPKSFKSFLTTHLAVAVAAGVPALGKHAVAQGRVLMFNAEDRPAMTRDRVAKMCRALDVSLAGLPLKLISVPVLRLDDAAEVARLSRSVASVRPALLILDPLRDLHGLDENDAKNRRGPPGAIEAHPARARL